MDTQHISTDLRPDHTKFWKVFGIILGTLIGAGTVIGVLGDAFYVRRTEYNATTNSAEISMRSLQQSVDNMTEAMKLQTQAIQRFTEQVQDLKTDVAVLKYRKQH